jgi:hypothetical protein
MALLGSAPKRRGQVKKRTVKEVNIENRFVQEAKKLGCKTRKLNGMGANDWPDRLVMVPGRPGKFITIEFKRPGGKLSSGQADWHTDAVSMGFAATTYVCFSWEEALVIVKGLMK